MVTHCVNAITMGRDERPFVPKRKNSICDDMEESLLQADDIIDHHYVPELETFDVAADHVHELLNYLDMNDKPATGSNARATKSDLKLDNSFLNPAPLRGAHGVSLGSRKTTKAAYLASLEKQDEHPSWGNRRAVSASLSTLPSASTEVMSQQSLSKMICYGKFVTTLSSSHKSPAATGNLREAFGALKNKYITKSCRSLRDPLPTIDEFRTYSRSISTGSLITRSLSGSSRSKTSLKLRMYRQPRGPVCGKHHDGHSNQKCTLLSTLNSQFGAESREQDRLLVKRSLQTSIDAALFVLAKGSTEQDEDSNLDSCQGVSSQSPTPSTSSLKTLSDMIVTKNECPSVGIKHRQDKSEPSGSSPPDAIPSAPLLRPHPFELLVQEGGCRPHPAFNEDAKHVDTAPKSPSRSGRTTDDSYRREMLREQLPKVPCRQKSPSALYRNTLALRLAGAAHGAAATGTRKTSSSRTGLNTPAA